MNLIQPVYAVIDNPALKNPLAQVNNPIGYTNSAIQSIFNIFIVVGIIYFIWHFMFAGYHFVAAEGDPKKYEQAKNEITYAFVGLICVFVVFAILKFIGSTLGITNLDNLSISLPSL